jgi:site-specific DNA-methyltransferase (adenine-specific)
MAFTLHHGDCREVMATLDAASVDAIVCDPPYGLSFMGKGWDHGVPGVEFWAEALRVAKPGAHLLAFGGTRTYHRLACAIEDAGWEIRDCVMWVYGSGFPKSHDVSKAIDKAAGAERETVRTGKRSTNAFNDRLQQSSGYRPKQYQQRTGEDYAITAPATNAARQWSGWGTALKPAWEPIIVARKPLVGTVAENVLTHGTGAINVDGCRVGNDLITTTGRSDALHRPSNSMGAAWSGIVDSKPHIGRWPANLIHDGSEEVVGLFPKTKSGGQNATSESQPGYAGGWTRPGGKGHHDSGSAARFFYCAKASKADRDEGCEGLEERVASVGNTDAAGRDGTNPNNYVGDSQRRRVEAGLPGTLPRRNHHPTVKPTALMRYLCRLVTPPGGVVLDPFTGSGSTGKGAVLEGFRFIGIEREAEYVKIAKVRIAAVSGGGTLF